MRKPRNESRWKRNIRTFILSHPLVPYKTLSGHLLTTDAMRILICCVYDNDDAFYFGFPTNTSHLDAYLGQERCKHPMNHIEMFHALNYLQEIGLIENLHGTIDNFKFQATYECMQFFQLRRKNFIHVFVNSICLPILISIITSLLVIYLSD